MIAHVYNTEQEANVAIEAINSLLPATEHYKLIENGQVVREWDEPAKTWAYPTWLTNDTWAVLWNTERLAGIAGKWTEVDGVPVQIPTAATAVDVSNLLPPPPSETEGN